ncbi:MAG: hypothetical protein AAGJ18_06870 [Bacteroidota bacterium]
MSVLELKGGMVELISRVKNKELLQHLYEIMSEVVADITEDSVILTAEQEAKLDQDIEASKNPSNLVDHEVAMRKMSKWLKK